MTTRDLTTMEPLRDVLEQIERPNVRCVSQYTDSGGLVDYELTWADWAADVAWTRRALHEWGLRPGDLAMVISTGHEAATYGPVIDAVNELGATVCPLEPADFELARAAMFFRRFPIAAVIGLDAVLGTALVREGALVAGDAMRFVLARREAVGLAAGLDGPYGVLAELGPAIAVTCPTNTALHVNERAWRITGPDARLTSLPGRHHAVVNLEVSTIVQFSPIPACCAIGAAVGRPSLAS